MSRYPPIPAVGAAPASDPFPTLREYHLAAAVPSIDGLASLAEQRKTAVLLSGAPDTKMMGTLTGSGHDRFHCVECRSDVQAICVNVVAFYAARSVMSAIVNRRMCGVSSARPLTQAENSWTERGSSNETPAL